MPKPRPASTSRTSRRRPAASLDGRLGLNQAEAAAAIGKSPSALRRWARIGLGPRFVRVSGRALVYPVADLTSWMNRNAQDPADVVG